MVGDNTDVYGFSEAIKLTNFNLKNKKALILGAGVVPSIILALKNMGILEIVLSNRTKAKAEFRKKVSLLKSDKLGGIHKIRFNN